MKDFVEKDISTRRKENIERVSKKWQKNAFH